MTWEEKIDNLVINIEREAVRTLVRNSIFGLLKERDKEWLSCLPPRIDDSSEHYNDCIENFLDNAKAKGLLPI